MKQSFAAHSHTPRLLLILLGNPSLVGALQPSRAGSSIHCFPDICSTFPFCVAGKGSGMEKALPRPLRPHSKGGEQSVRSPPATVGHICGHLAAVWAALQPGLPLHSVALPPRCFCVVSHTLESKNWLQEQPERRTFSSLIMPSPPSLLSLTIYTEGGDTWKGITPFAGMEGKDLATSAERLTAACHTPARMNDFHLLAPSHSDTHTVKPGERGTHTHTFILYI